MKNNFISLKSLFVGALVASMFFACKKEDTIAPDVNPSDTTTRPDSTKNPMDSTYVQTWPDSSRYEQAKIFPGLVGASVQRIEDTTISLDLNYHDVEHLRMATPPKPLFSTGLYAPAGEKIKITVPAGLSGLSVQIGAWTDDLYNEDLHSRSPLIFVQKRLNTGENVVWNLYGGPIYILAEKPITNTVELSVSGAVKEPDFVLGETNPTAWWSKVQNTDVPWLELRSDDIVFTVSRHIVLQNNLNDPTQLLNAWKNSIKSDFYDWMGLKENPSDAWNQLSGLPFRAVLDTQILGDDDVHAGAPIMLENNSENIDALLNPSNVTQGKVEKIYNAFGENKLQTPLWAWDGITSGAKYIFGVHATHRLNKKLTDLYPDIASAVPDAMGYVEDLGAKNFDKSHSDLFKLVPFLQIFEKTQDISTNVTSGYDFIPFLYKAARKANTLSSSNQEKRDFFYTTLADFLHLNPILFFNAWGINISFDAISNVEDKGYDRMNKTLWTYDPIQDTGGTGIVSPYNNTTWRIVDVSSKESDQPAAYAIDGDVNTYWQSRLSPPQHIIFDMGTNVEVGSFYFYQNQSSLESQLKRVDVAVSSDGQTWNYLSTFYLDHYKDKQVFRLDSKHTFRYFKLTIPNDNSIYNSDVVRIAEVGVNQDFGGIPEYSATNSDPYDRKNWTILAVSSQQMSEGPVDRILDGNAGTYWHNEYGSFTEKPPHFVIIDMHDTLDVYGFSFTQRSGGSRNIKNLTVEVSNDLRSWTTIDVYHLEKKGGKQVFELNNKKSFRYVRLSTRSTSDVYDGTNFLSLAEFNVMSHPYDPYDPSNWSITATSAKPSQPISNAIDGNASSYWIAYWRDGHPPYTLIIDMKKPLQVSSFNFIQNINPLYAINKLELFKSDDGTDWTSLGTFTLDPLSTDVQNISLGSAQTFQYFKIYIATQDDIGDPDNRNNTQNQWAALAEVSVNKN